MMVVETVRWTPMYEGEWHTLALTQSEIELLKTYLNEIKPPVYGGTINPGDRFRFMPNIWVYAFEFDGREWNTQYGWRPAN